VQEENYGGAGRSRPT